jgi:hypothetical protein
MIFLELFLIGFGLGIRHPAAPSIVFDKCILWKINFVWDHVFKISKGLRIKMSFFPPTHAEVQWWISSVILQTSCLEDVNLRITSVRLCKIKRLKVFSPWFPASWARSRSSTNPAFYTNFSLLLDFSGSVGFGTWRIYVPLFWATCRLFSIFLVFWILERFCLWILLLCLPMSF